MRSINNSIEDYEEKKLNNFRQLGLVHQKKSVESSLGSKFVQSDKQIKQLLQEYQLQMCIGKQKQRKIKRIIQQNEKITSENQKILKQISQVQQQIEKLKKTEIQEESKQQEEESQQEIKQFMYAYKIQNQGFKNLGLNQSEIQILPTFQYQKMSESEISCLSCYQQLQNNVDIKCLPCCHTFHDNCITQHLSQSRYCPACSQQVIVIS